MKFNKNILLILLLIVAHLALCQDQQYMNQKKYWFYRNRLINEFCKVGLNQGESMVASLKNDETRSLKFGDQTIRLGHYIGVLSTEYELLRKNSQNTNQTLYELYCALKVLERLDRTAESYFRTPSSTLPSDLNGFFIRDDMPSSMISHFAIMNNTANISSDFIDGQTSSDPKAALLKEMSHDQVSHLMIGLSLLKKYIPDQIFNITDPNSSIISINLHLYGNDLIKRIIEYMATGNVANDVNCDFIKNNIDKGSPIPSIFFFKPCNPGSPFIRNGITNNLPWMIDNPVTNIPVLRGAFPVLLSYGYSRAGQKITGNSYYYHPIFRREWGLYPKNPYFYKVGDNHKILSLAAMGDSWDFLSTEVQVQYCSHCIWYSKKKKKCKINVRYPCNINIGLGTANYLDILSKDSHYEYLPLLYKLIYNRPGFRANASYYNNFYPNILRLAPCRGPWFYNANDKAGNGWASDNILYQATFEKKYKDIGNHWVWYLGNDNFTGEYSGLDYMLLYNLYNLYSGSHPPYYVNYGNNLDLINHTVAGKEYYTARGYHVNGTFFNGNIKVNNFNGPAGTSVELRAANSISIINSSFTSVSISIYQPADNSNWEIESCPNGFRIATDEEPWISKDEQEDSDANQETFTSIKTEEPILIGNSPNPCKGPTSIVYKLSEDCPVTMIITDMYGRQIVVEKGIEGKGIHELIFDTSQLPSGVSYYTLQAGNKLTETKRMIIIK